MCILESQENSMNTWIIIHEEEKGVMKDSIRCDEVLKESIRFDEDF
jgi:hypothetical protein